jgi:hypothetical protein
MPAHWPVAPLFVGAALLLGWRRERLAREWLLDTYLAGAWITIAAACALSALQRLDSAAAWAVTGALALTVAAVFKFFRLKAETTGESEEGPDLGPLTSDPRSPTSDPRSPTPDPRPP